MADSLNATRSNGIVHNKTAISSIESGDVTAPNSSHASQSRTNLPELNIPKCSNITNTTSRRILNKIIIDTKKHRKHRSKLQDTLFYKIVLGGNLNVVRHVTNELKARGCDDDLYYLFKTRNSSDSNTTGSSGPSLPKRIISCLCIAFCVFIVTPIFYLVHSIVNEIHYRWKVNRKIKDCIPLLFAVLSGNKDMVNLFLSMGCKWHYIDENCNNIFHSLFYQSTAEFKLEKVISCVKMIQSFMACDISNHLIFKQCNKDGHTAYEVLVKYGSPEVLSYVSNVDGFLKYRLMHVSEQSFTYDDNFIEMDDMSNCWSCWQNKEHGSIEHECILLEAQECDMKPNIFEGELTNSLNTDLYDVTDYEKSSIGRQSLLLNLYANKAYIDLKENEFDHMSGIKFLSIWAESKIQAAISILLLLHLRDLAVTMLLVFLLFQSGGDGNEFPLRHEFEAKRSSIFVDRMSNIHSPAYGDDVGSGGNAVGGLITGNANPDRLMPIETPINDSVIVASADEIFFFMLEVDEYYGEYFRETLENGIGMYALEDLFSQVPNYTESLNPFRLYPVVCANDFTIDGTSCNEDAFAALLETCAKLTYIEIEGFIFDEDSRSQYDYELKYMVLNILSWVLFAFAVAYIFVDLVDRICFLVSRTWDARGNWRAAMFVHVPGSYIQKQLHILASLSILFLLVDALEKGGRVTMMEEKDTQTRKSYLLVTAMVARFLAHIHSFRLLPGIGHFINTSVKMARDLIHFSIAYIGVVLLFGLLFHMLMRDDSCPAVKPEGYNTLFLSIYEAFKMSIGQADPPESNSGAVTVSYVLFAIMCGLLLLNMIIAVMSNTASIVMTAQLRELSWQTEWLKECLSVELTYKYIIDLISGCRKSGATLSYRGHFNKTLHRYCYNGEERIYVDKETVK